jgi:hypothetical protein
MGQLPRKPTLPITIDSIYAYLELVCNVIAHKISFGSTFNANGTGNNDVDNNMDCWKATGTTPAGADTEFSISHNLTRIPIMFIGFLDKAGTLYSYYGGMTAWTAATSAGNDGKVYLKCTASSANYRVILF